MPNNMRERLLDRISNWTTDDVVALLERNNLSECCDAVVRRNIGGDEFLNLSEENLILWRNDLTRPLRGNLSRFVADLNNNPEQYLVEENYPSSSPTGDLSETECWDTDFEDFDDEDSNDSSTMLTNGNSRPQSASYFEHRQRNGESRVSEEVEDGNDIYANGTEIRSSLNSPVNATPRVGFNNNIVLKLREQLKLQELRKKLEVEQNQTVTEKRPDVAKHFGNKPNAVKPFGNQPENAKPFENKPNTAKPFGNKPENAKPFGNRPDVAKLFENKPDAAKSFGNKPENAKLFGNRPDIAKPFENKPNGVKPIGNKPENAKPFGNRPDVTKPFGNKPESSKPFGNKPDVARPNVVKPFGNKPDAAKPFGNKPGVENPLRNTPKVENPSVTKSPFVKPPQPPIDRINGQQNPPRPELPKNKPRILPPKPSSVSKITNLPKPPSPSSQLLIGSLDLVADLPLDKADDSDEYEQIKEPPPVQRYRSLESMRSGTSTQSLASGRSTKGSNESVYLPPSISSVDDDHDAEIYESINEQPEERDAYVKPRCHYNPPSSTSLPRSLPAAPSTFPIGSQLLGGLGARLADEVADMIVRIKRGLLRCCHGQTSESPETPEPPKPPERPAPVGSKTFPCRDERQISDTRTTRPLPPTPSNQKPERPAEPPERNFNLSSYTDQPWFHNLRRQDADSLISGSSANFSGSPPDGYFLLRPSSRMMNQPWTLVLWYVNRVYNIAVRRRPDLRYALGSQKLNEQSFLSIEELVSFYEREELVLHTSSGDGIVGRTRLTETPPH